MATFCKPNDSKNYTFGFNGIITVKKPDKQMKNILITNDDGYESEGLIALANAVRGLGRVTIVAPASEKSACGHSLTLTRPLRFIKVDDDFYKLDDGTPSDCVYLALNSLFEETKPDLILSGVNKGSNMGEDITYSGTASAAMEGALHGVPSIAFSQLHRHMGDHSYVYDFDVAAMVAKELAEKALSGRFPLKDRRFLNVNIPVIQKKEYKGMRITRAGYRRYGNDAHMHRNPRGEEHYWLGLHPLSWSEYDYGDKNYTSDFEAIKEGFVSVTPVKLDMTAHDELDALRGWIG